MSAGGPRRRLPEHLPILNRRMARGDYRPRYAEREITAPVDLCDARGVLNPDAVGWSRFPIVRANLSGHWPRKKRWNFWNWISRDFVFSVTLADLDYASFCAATFSDFAAGQTFRCQSNGRPGRFAMPEHVERSVSFRGGGLEYANVNAGGDLEVDFRGRTRDGVEIVADFRVHKPPDHESLNVVVPWTDRRFQLNSKHNTLPCEGHVTVAGRRHAMEPATCHAVQDFGRGIWPYRSFWNWAVCTGEQAGHRIGVNLGGKWTTGTGANENGILLDGRLHKIMEDLHWSYDPRDWMKPWRIRSLHSDTLDLTLRPRMAHRSSLNLGLLATGGVCCFGAWRGWVRIDGQSFEIEDLVGWAEEFAHRW
ncbi:MAG: DUF2804 domain-containing protein [Deltaproteobacteria bacterium]|nr:MAG: DUF2804 domain-containing protein [Deltaproteobacteria bacterium]